MSAAAARSPPLSCSTGARPSAAEDRIRSGQVIGDLALRADQQPIARAPPGRGQERGVRGVETHQVVQHPLRQDDPARAGRRLIGELDQAARPQRAIAIEGRSSDRRQGSTARRRRWGAAAGGSSWARPSSRPAPGSSAGRAASSSTSRSNAERPNRLARSSAAEPRRCARGASGPGSPAAAAATRARTWASWSCRGKPPARSWDAHQRAGDLAIGPAGGGQGIHRWSAGHAIDQRLQVIGGPLGLPERKGQRRGGGRPRRRAAPASTAG